LRIEMIGILLKQIQKLIL